MEVKTRLKRDNPYRGRAGAPIYQRRAAELKASPEGRICVVCGGEIDTSMPPEMQTDPGYSTVQHYPPLSVGGDLLESMAGAAHRGCNLAEDRAMQLSRDRLGGSEIVHETSRDS